MNSIDLRIRIDSITKQLLPDGTVEVSGQCSFKFSDRGTTIVRKVPFIARNGAAETLLSKGLKTIFFCSGSLRVYRTEGQPNPELLYQINQACPDGNISAGNGITNGSSKNVPTQPESDSNGTSVTQIEQVQRVDEVPIIESIPISVPTSIDESGTEADSGKDEQPTTTLKPEEVASTKSSSISPNEAPKKRELVAASAKTSKTKNKSAGNSSESESSPDEIPF